MVSIFPKAKHDYTIRKHFIAVFLRTVENLELDRSYLKASTELVTGYYKLRDHMNRISLAQDRLYMETTEHIQYKCSAVTRIRYQVIDTTTRGSRTLLSKNIIIFIIGLEISELIKMPHNRMVLPVHDLLIGPVTVNLTYSNLLLPK